MDPARRRARYAKLSTELAHLDDAGLRELVGGSAGATGWGDVRTVELAGERVFVKIIPLTDLELTRPHSTSNHYRLPSFYQYGVGSAGFGAWREIVACLTTTNWVLADASAAFPLTYHARVVRRTGRTAGPPDLDGYVRYWNSSRSIGRYLAERAGGTHEALIFLELLPHSLTDWLARRPEDAPRLIGQLIETVGFLRGQGIVHFDAHLGNLLTDGETAYLADYGLLLDSRFALSVREREFLARHRLYDVGELLTAFGAQLERWFRALPPDEQEQAGTVIEADADAGPMLRRNLVRHAERLDGLAHPALVEAVVRHRPVIEFMNDFFAGLQSNPRKNTRYDDDLLRDLLQAAEIQTD
ncbi:hypothetical protein [Microlunatus sp. GCM10028923]|uniref:hypothetical protein n=1 Tax=Microlunatus sp. GCM10028923 TaxID=3273400 RepID=UPI00361FB068